MNERIKELAEQAGVTGHFAAGTEYATLIPLSDEVKKFAELLIRECSRIADRKYLYSKEPNRWDSGFNISCEILEQFGIDSDSESEIEYCPKCNDEWSGTSCGIPDCGWITGEDDERTN